MYEMLQLLIFQCVKTKQALDENKKLLNSIKLQSEART